jgi:hypothetical protein
MLERDEAVSNQRTSRFGLQLRAVVVRLKSAEIHTGVYFRRVQEGSLSASIYAIFRLGLHPHPFTPNPKKKPIFFHSFSGLVSVSSFRQLTVFHPFSIPGRLVATFFIIITNTRRSFEHSTYRQNGSHQLHHRPDQ